MRRPLLLTACSTLLACASVAPTCEESSPLVGTWRYSALRESPTPGVVHGTLAIQSAGCGVLTGQIDITETDEFGASQRLAGPVTGAVFTGGAIRFDAELSGGVRQHLATVQGDSIEGSWARVDAAAASSGMFGGRKQ